MTGPAIVSDAQAERSFIDSITERFEKEDVAANAPAPEKAVVVPPASETPKPSAPEPDADVSAPPSETPKPTETDDIEAQPEKDADAADEEAVEEPTEEEVDAEFKAEADKQKIALTVDDLPDEAKPLVRKRIKELESGFTRAMQDARSYRTEEAQFRAEQKFQSENRAQFIADLLLKNPTLGDAVNELLDGLTTDTARKAHDIVVRDARAKALDDTTATLKAHETRAARGQALENYTRTQAMKLNVPFENVNDAIVADIFSRAPGNDITERDIDLIVAEKAKRHEMSLRAARREASKKYVESKVDAQKNGGLKVKPGSGNAPAPAAQKKPTTDAEFSDVFIAKMK